MEQLLQQLLDYLTQTGETLASQGFALIVKQQVLEAPVYHTWGVALAVVAGVIIIASVFLLIHELEEDFVIGSVFLFGFGIAIAVAAGLCLQSAYYHTALPEYQALKEILSAFSSQ
jgi:hypothetical protein